MSKKRFPKKRVIILVSSIAAIVAIAVGSYYWYLRPFAATAPPSEVALSEAKELRLAGNQTLSAKYIDQINAKDTAAAQTLFDTAFAQAPDDAARELLLSQNVTLALTYGQTAAAEQAVLDAIKLRPSYATYNDAYRVYVALRDYPKQQQMIESALAAAKTEDRTDKEQLIAALESQLQVVKRFATKDAE